MAAKALSALPTQWPKKSSSILPLNKDDVGVRREVLVTVYISACVPTSMESFQCTLYIHFPLLLLSESYISKLGRSGDRGF